MHRSLMVKTHSLLCESKKPLPDIYAELRMAGIEDISFYWLRKFRYGGVNDPSVNKIQCLYEYLTGLPLTF